MTWVSQFFVSLEDNLMRLFGSERIARLMDRMGLKEGEVIQAGMMSKAIERAQRKVEENNFGIRKRLLEYDDVMNSQREVIYTRRRHALYGERIEVDLNNIMVDFAETFVDTYYDNDTDYEDFKFELIRQVAVRPFVRPERVHRSEKGSAGRHARQGLSGGLRPPYERSRGDGQSRYQKRIRAARRPIREYLRACLGRAPRIPDSGESEESL